MCQSFEKACQLGDCKKLRRVKKDKLCKETNPAMLDAEEATPYIRTRALFSVLD